MTEPALPQTDERPAAPPLDLLGVTAGQLRRFAAGWFGTEKGGGLAGALHRDAVVAGTFDPERHGAGPRAAATWRRHAALRLPELVAQIVEPAEHGCIAKRVLRLHDGRTVESVRLPMGRGRHNLCVSTQVGCARACTFCETGRLGLLRNLSAGEIVGQVVSQVAADEAGGRPHGVVFQGMGEPLDNLDGLLPALEVLLDRHGLGYAQERLTVCTVGHVPGIEALQAKGWKRLGLSLSLNAADDAQRAALMPHSVRYPLRELQRALGAYRQRRNFALGVHWCLLPGVNDARDDARRLAEFVRPLGRALVQVIPYNPGSAPIARAPEEHEVVRFVSWLREHGVAVRRRITKGRSVMAACGQLGGLAARSPH
ncbi:MAG: radical SAM protein [Planctomycetes bacterium]|nr:radical SAM protein [Planctomycetota bacterium]